MKKHWLRRMLLGVSMTLLLTGGIALAQSLTVEPDCFQCWRGTREEFERVQPGYPYSYSWDSCGWRPGVLIWYTETFVNSYRWDEHIEADQTGCVSSRDRWAWTCQGEPAHHRSGSVSATADGEFPDDFWGPFEVCVESVGNTDASASAIVCETILFAEVCEEEFVPEPGSILLLGSGLAGRAAYAGLRLKRR